MINWQCPVCNQPLSLSERTLRCADNHCFDRAKEGYFNLLLVNQKRSKEPGDSKAMLQGRRNFLEAGHYAPLVDALKTQLAAVMPGKLLDIGCGEGYYAAQLVQAEESSVCAVDIARDGVRMAAKRFKGRDDCGFAVASSYRLPLGAEQFDAALQVFAPVSESEVVRVLKPKGIYCEVSPGPYHLAALKRELYGEVKSHRPPELLRHLQLIDEQRVSFDLQLGSAQALQNLLLMTPFYFKGSREAKQKLQSFTQFSTPADFIVRRYQKRTGDE